MITISVNGRAQSINEPCTVERLLDQHGLAASPCAVEVNRSIVPKAQHPTHELRDGDRIEIVTLVGGG